MKLKLLELFYRILFTLLVDNFYFELDRKKQLWQLRHFISGRRGRFFNKIFQRSN